MNILILGLNYAPEQVGIGPYTTGMAEALAAAGHRVSVVAGKPYYPHWQVDKAYTGIGYRRSIENGVEIIRCPIYVPRNPSGRKRLVHHASFAVAAMPVMLNRALSLKPNVVMTIAPSLIATPVARLIAKVTRAKLWLHIQDFEVEAAFATRLIDDNGRAARAARAFENWSLTADRVSAISPQMCRKLVEKGVPPDRVIEFRNWSDIDRIRPLDRPSSYRREWAIAQRNVALYSGNIANKQGIDLVINAAKLLSGRQDLIFIICGNGSNRDRLIQSAGGLKNIRFADLQPAERMRELLGLATVHLLPQIAGAADLLLPSKLTNMLASGRPVVATAEADTGLAQEIAGCGLVTPPGDARSFADAISRILDQPVLQKQFGIEARRRAEERWSAIDILNRFERDLTTCVNES